MLGIGELTKASQKQRPKEITRAPHTKLISRPRTNITKTSFKLARGIISDSATSESEEEDYGSPSESEGEEYDSLRRDCVGDDCDAASPKGQVNGTELNTSMVQSRAPRPAKRKGSPKARIEGSISQALEEEKLASRPVSQPFPKISPHIDIRSKRPIEIAELEKGAVDRSFNPKIMPAHHRYERLINRTDGRNTPTLPLKRTIDQRLKLSKRKTPLVVPSKERGNPDDFRQAPKRALSTKIAATTTSPVPREMDRMRRDDRWLRFEVSAVERRQEHLPRSSGRDRPIVAKNSFLEEFLEIAEMDPYAAFKR